MSDVLLRDILAFSGQTAIVIAVAAALRAGLKLTAAARLRCFQALLAACLLLPFAQPWRVPVAKGSVTISSFTISTGDAAASVSSGWQLSYSQIVVAILAAGILVRLAIVAIGMLRLRRYVERARFVPDALAMEKERAGVWPDVFVSEELKGPVTFGLFRPAILIPARWIENETVAYHELLHVRRRDWGFTVLEELVRALLWFHPGFWWLIGQIQLAREQVVDSEVVRLMQSREQYLDTLLAIAEAKAGLDLAPAPLFLKKRHLRQRVAALLKEVNMSKIRIRSSVAGFTAVLALAGWMATRSFPLQAAPQAPKDSPGVTVQVDEGKLLHRAPVNYPADAIRKGIQGTVMVEATLDQNGEVSDAQVLSGPQELRRAALESVLQWHYNKDAGLPPKVQIAIDFALPAAGTPAAIGLIPSLPQGPMPVSRIDVSALPQPLRDIVSSRLPIHAGDEFTNDSAHQIEAALAGIDEHLHLRVGLSPDGKGIAVHVALNDAPPMAPKRIRVGGNVQSNNLIEKVIPKYPPEAKQERIQGTVRFTATIGKDGHIVDLQLVSGHPLLAQAAREAVAQWVYRPTLLNGDPVEVVTQIDVNFTLSDNPSGAPPAAPQH